MTEFNEYNLPADFDDLSKHAPLLEKIRAKGDGFVVPVDYFAEAEQLSVAGCQLSAISGRQSAAGFVVPENYFDELAERIIAVASLSSLGDRGQPTADCFSVPEGYFEKLTDEILAVAKLSDLKTGESFEVPDSYFNELDETINTKLALDNLKQDEGFGVPENYFENFSDKILSQVAMDELAKGSDADVPPGYFDTLADRISARIAEEEGAETGKAAERGRIIVFAEVLKRYARPISMAASVALIVSVAVWFFNREEQKVEIAGNKPVKENTRPVVPAPQKDSVQIIIQPKEAIAAQPEIKKPKPVNPGQQPVVKEIDSKDILAQVDQLDESMVADYFSEVNMEVDLPQQEESLNTEMLNYLLDNNMEPSDINK